MNLPRSTVERIIATPTHGRYLVVAPASPGPVALLVGFHGYGEEAERQLDRLLAIPGSDGWLIVSIQGLHRFYQRQTNAVVASWMTRQHRELAIADNNVYVAATLDDVVAAWPTVRRIVFAGFSQGVAMAFRAAASSAHSTAGVIAVGGDIPPELDAPNLRRVGSVLVCRGNRDEWYAANTFTADLRRLEESRLNVQRCEFDGGHEWSQAVNDAAAGFLQQSYRLG